MFAAPIGLHTGPLNTPLRLGGPRSGTRYVPCNVHGRAPTENPSEYAHTLHKHTQDMQAQPARRAEVLLRAHR